MGEGRLKSNKHRLVSWKKGNEEYRELADVNVQDQDTRAIDIRVNIVLDATLKLLSQAVIDQYDVVLEPGHGLVNGDFLAILEQNGSPQIYFGQVLNVAVDTITMDTPVPFGFTPAGAVVLKYDPDLAVDGSVTTQVAYLENFFDDAVDLVRFIPHITDGDSMDDGKFGGIAALPRGIVLRRKNNDGTYTNYWNVKTNGEFGELAYDKTYDPRAPAGVYGITVRATYGGQSKHGVVIRLEPGERIEVLIQDDLTGLTSFNVMVQGHVTE